MMNKKIFFLVAALSLFFSCEEDRIIDSFDNDKKGNETKSTYSPALNNPNVKKGVIYVKFKEEVGNTVSIFSENGVVQSNVRPFNTLLKNINARGMKRLFPYAGKFEKRTRKEGLHLWYVVNFDENVLVANVLSSAGKMAEIEIVEESYKIELPEYTMKNVSDNGIVQTADKLPMNDPFLKKQWHYNNDGSVYGYVKGADINLFKAWEEETGKSNVIVCVVDGGIDHEHEDLKDNMYINVAERDGVAGKDDDDNGYIDDIYGYNFYDDKGQIEPQDHGTHVAGTVSARNNNGIGVCGVAGGNGSAESGVKLMTAQVFRGKFGGGMAVAIKYGADNGAVISQNSWGYPYPGPENIPYVDKAAINYFIKYAGCDVDGNQLPDSPMKGGVVIFAAGNDDKDVLTFPAAYEPTVAVTAMGPDLKRGYYSNHGTWADIIAPGGNKRFQGGEIYSTVPNNKYDYMSGTSMACPHVSGIAALIVSKYGKQGFTNKELKKKLLSGLRPFNIDKYNPKYIGKLGIGYIDAKATLQEEKDNTPPLKPTFREVKSDFTELTVVWTAVKDENDEMPIAYNLYYSKDIINEGNYKNTNSIKVSGFGYDVGTPVSYVLKNLPLNTKFYFAIEAVDRWGAVSALDFINAKTKENKPPVIRRVDTTPIRIKEKETASLKLIVDEPEGQKWFYEINGFKRGVSYTKEKDGLLFKFRVEKPLGKHSFKVTVRDIFRASTEIEIPFEYYKNAPPVLSHSFKKIYAPINKVHSIDLNKYFNDPEGEKLTFSVKSSTTFIATRVKENILEINPSKIGMANIKVTAKDIEGAEFSTILPLQSVNDAIVYLMYPIPVEKILNIQLSNEVNKANLIVRTVAGKRVLEKNISVVANNRHITLNLSKFSGGTYVLEVEANGEKFEQTFVKY